MFPARILLDVACTNKAVRQTAKTFHFFICVCCVVYGILNGIEMCRKIAKSGNILGNFHKRLMKNKYVMEKQQKWFSKIYENLIKCYG